MTTQQMELLQKLEMIGNLESVVTEQKIRIEKLRTTYETLKAEHVQLKEVNERKEKELKDSKNEMRKIQDLSQETLQKMRIERDAKNQECEELRIQLVTPQRIEMLKAQLQKELEGPYKERCEALDMEITKYSSDFNKLRYDYSFLKSEYEHEQLQHKQIVGEMQAHFDMEIGSLKQERDCLLRRCEQQPPPDAQNTRELQRENAQVSRLQARQLIETTAKCKSLETDCDSLKLQCETLHAEFEKNSHTQEEVTKGLNRLEEERMSLIRQMEEMSHKHKVEESNLKISSLKNLGNLQRECDMLKAEIANYKNKVEVLERTIEHLKKAINDKEDYLKNTLQSAREEEWEKVAKLEQGKLQLEARVKQLERSNLASEVALKTETDILEEKLRSTSETKSLVQKECNQLREELQGLQNMIQELDKVTKEKQRNQDLKLKQQELQNQCQSHLSNEQQLVGTIERLKTSLELVNEELGIARSDLEKQEEEDQLKLDLNKKEWNAEKRRLQMEIKELSKQIRGNEESLRKCIQDSKKKSKKHHQEISRLKEKIIFLETREQQLRQEHDVVQKRLTLENEKIERQLEKFKKRQNRLKSALHSGQSGGLNLFPTSSLSGPVDMTLAKDLERQEVTPEIDQPQKHIGQLEEFSE
ncbi:PREDICTED: centrosomal protein of 83 kDa-like isoform X3 [Acropora digitifera]|uniref:centrosomal protein of 83 kDa-like isoform X3 n=1 Tax=Acropora digitifera TaxID=70779 RepID=UPI00077A7C09|nr:PREDICTED: centrosomal protein of 83 kDa-like isoform X3 [Acropora digitifera]